MGPLGNVGRIQFCVETLLVKDGRRLGRVRCDERGYYPIPMAVFGVPSQNNAIYDTPAFIDQITGKDSFVRKMIEDGKLYGEYGHPWIAALPRELIIPRLVHIDEHRVSHHIEKLWTGETLSNGGVILMGSVKPTGPFGHLLKQNFDEPTMNTAFSLRSVTAERDLPDGMKYRTMRRLVTLDAVLAGGFAEAAKRYSPAVENLQHAPGSTWFKPALEGFAISVDNWGGANFEHVALESFSDTELNEYFGAKKIVYRNQTLTYLPTGGALLASDASKRGLRSLYHELLARG